MSQGPAGLRVQFSSPEFSAEEEIPPEEPGESPNEDAEDPPEESFPEREGRSPSDDGIVAPPPSASSPTPIGSSQRVWNIPGVLRPFDLTDREGGQCALLGLTIVFHKKQAILPGGDSTVWCVVCVAPLCHHYLEFARGIEAYQAYGALVRVGCPVCHERDFVVIQIPSTYSLESTSSQQEDAASDPESAIVTFLKANGIQTPMTQYNGEIHTAIYGTILKSGALAILRRLQSMGIPASPANLPAIREVVAKLYSKHVAPLVAGALEKEIQALLSPAPPLPLSGQTPLFPTPAPPSPLSEPIDPALQKTMSQLISYRRSWGCKVRQALYRMLHRRSSTPSGEPAPMAPAPSPLEGGQGSMSPSSPPVTITLKPNTENTIPKPRSEETASPSTQGEGPAATSVAPTNSPSMPSTRRPARKPRAFTTLD